jgi:MFS family permease
MIRRYSGRLSDRAGRKPLIVLGRTGTFLYPLFYAFATTSTHLYVAEFLIGVVGSISEIAVFAYMLDITSEEQRGASIAVHNTLIGFATFLGSILGGYFVGFFTLLGMDPATSIVASYFVSSGGRLVSGLLFLRLKETYVYPSTIRRELVDIVTEDMEKTQNRIKKIDEIGEKAELEFVRDMENFETTPERHRKSEDAKQIDEERQKKNPKKDTQKS